MQNESFIPYRKFMKIYVYSTYNVNFELLMNTFQQVTEKLIYSSKGKCIKMYKLKLQETPLIIKKTLIFFT